VSRQRLLAAVRARVERFNAGHDPAAVLDPEAVAELTALFETVPDPAADIEIASAAGWLHWFRYLVLDPGDNEQDLRGALTQFLPVYRVRPDAVPAQVRTHFGRVEASADPYAVAQRAVVLLREALGTADQGALDAVVDLLRLALAAATPAGHPSRTAMLFNLGGALQERFARVGDRTDLDAAVDLLRQVAAASPAGHPDRATMLSDLGSALFRQFARTENQGDLDAAIDAGQRAVAVEVASPRVRAVAAQTWGRAAASGQRWEEAVAGFAQAAELLGLTPPRSLTRRDQEEQLTALGDLGELAADAAACCVQAGLPGRALELFEQGRGILLGQALDTRTDLTALTRQHPDLAARFSVLRGDLDQAADTAGPPAATGAAAVVHAEAADRDMERRRAAAAAFDQVISEIRRLPGFRGFLRPPPVAELLAAAAEGPVVVVTVSRFGSYALILADGGVLDPVPLAGLTPETVYYRVVAFLGALEDASSPAVGAERWAAAEQQLDDTLGWLWDELAGPVLDRLRITGPPRGGQPWPRLWWCLSGLLSFLPGTPPAGTTPAAAPPAPPRPP